MAHTEVFCGSLYMNKLLENIGKKYFMINIILRGKNMLTETCIFGTFASGIYKF